MCLPTLAQRLEVVTEKCGIKDEEMTISMGGCPNSCGRPSMAEIGFIGKAPGTRLNTLYKESVTEDQIIALLTPLFGRFGTEREKGETFGNFCVRTGVVKPMV